MKDCVFIETEGFKIHFFWYSFTFSFMVYSTFLDTKIHMLIPSDCAIDYSYTSETVEVYINIECTCVTAEGRT